MPAFTFFTGVSGHFPEYRGLRAASAVDRGREIRGDREVQLGWEGESQYEENMKYRNGIPKMHVVGEVPPSAVATAATNPWTLCRGCRPLEARFVRYEIRNAPGGLRLFARFFIFSFTVDI
jgi:hypothetical protein